MNRPVEKLASYILVTDEQIVDHRIGTQADQLAAARRIEVNQRALQEYWESLPWWTRTVRAARARIRRSHEAYRRWLRARAGCEE